MFRHDFLVGFNNFRKSHSTDFKRNPIVLYNFRAIARSYKFNYMYYNCAAPKLFMPFVIQIPIWVCTSMALRNLSSLQHISNNSYGQEVIEAKLRFMQMSQEGNNIDG